MRVVNMVNNRGNERFSPGQIGLMLGTANTGGARRMLEQARRQGLLDSSWQLGPTGERDRLYQSWNYVALEPEDVSPNEVLIPAKLGDEQKEPAPGGADEEDIWF